MTTTSVSTLGAVSKGDKVQIVDNYQGHTKVVTGVIQKVNRFSGGSMSVLLNDGKDFYGEATTRVWIEVNPFSYA